MPVKRSIDDYSEGEDTTYDTKRARRQSARTRRKSGISCDSSFPSPTSSDTTPGFQTRSDCSAARQSLREDSEESSDSEIIFVEAPVLVKKGKTVEKHFSDSITISGKTLHPTVAFDTFWRFAAERKAIDDRRRAGLPAPWTKDIIMQKYFFCNTFRVLDKGCQFLIKEVIEKGSQDPEEVVFRVILFNTFTKIETWELLDRELGPLKWSTYNRAEYRKVLSRAVACGMTLYTGAYIKPAPHFGESTNYANHLCFLETLMDSKLASRLLVAPYMADVYEYIYSFPSMGPFSTYQLMLCLSYTNVLNFNSNDFVISGPGSISGLKKIFGKSMDGHRDDLVFHQDVMRYFVESQDFHFRRLGLEFSGLGPKRLPMDLADIEHTLCEVDKYCRAAHPQLKGKRTNMHRLHQPSSPPKRHPAVLPKAWTHPARRTPRIRPQKVLVLEKRYEIERIADDELVGGVRKFLVYWKGYPASDATWEFESSLVHDAPGAVKDYLSKPNKR
ncbi:unnamed protein product [Cyclocybe aegerita]|uniref:Chromo domain-containing protein n=1 Tax=Cyclocybe aegerita TaxID=1973307 RepID=A0A8S0XHG5_CYCAE|nr:unnamed protein product [Cyclocybe aegerita]